MKKIFILVGILSIFILIIYSDTISDLKESLEKNPDNLKLKMDLADEYYKIGNYKKAIEFYNDIIKKKKDENIYYRLVMSHYNLKEYKKAYNLNLKLEKNYLKNINNELIYNLYINIGINLLSKDIDFSKKVFQKVYNYDKNNFNANIALGIINFNERKYDKSLKLFINAYNNMPENFSDRNNLILNIISSALNKGQNVYFNNNSTEKSKEIALSYFNRAIDFIKKLPEDYLNDNIDKWIYAYFLKAKTLIDFKRLEEGKELLFYTYNKSPDLIGLYEEISNLALIFQDKSDYYSAISCYKEIISDNIDDANLLYNLSTYYYELNHYEYSLFYLSRSNDLSKNEEKIHVYKQIMDRFINKLYNNALNDFKKGDYRNSYIKLSKILYYRENDRKTRDLIKNIPDDIIHSNYRNYFTSNKNESEKVKTNINLAGDLKEKALEKYENHSYVEAYNLLLEGMNLYYPHESIRNLFLKVYPNITYKIEKGKVIIDRYLSNGKIKAAETHLNKIDSILKNQEIENLTQKISIAKKQEKYDKITTFENNIVYYYNQGDYNRAIEYTNRILNIEPDNNFAQNYYRRIKKRERNLISKYRDLFEKAQKQKNIDEMYKNVNNILLIDKNNQWAINKREELNRKLSSFNKEKVENLYYEGIKNYTSGNYKEALRKWSKIIEIYGNYKNTNEYIKRVKDRLN
ncbi:MAG TPA: tetratricopeptide repeat protein [Candidatus Mcinerneyibacterium sp.]|nr:tetratricopeptide repeat protein [Candidatus Mcinerneyibacterium sp.]